MHSLTITTSNIQRAIIRVEGLQEFEGYIAAPPIMQGPPIIRATLQVRTALLHEDMLMCLGLVLDLTLSLQL